MPLTIRTAKKFASAAFGSCYDGFSDESERKLASAMKIYIAEVEIASLLNGRALVEEKPGAKTERRNKNRIAKAGPSAGIGRPPSPATLCLLPIAPSRNGAVGAATGSGLIKSGFLRYFATFDIVYNSVNEQH
ncbi:unnamed protein product [Nippostrongylus brasiliensis]|uniref:Transposase n=1 Tax=Nippostrongylus brasiliensis TaxID=27835 RepID=A0A0N4Y5X8_NIPBR|nr:unnamed protein product [Nippostrongylus brasiliensis]